jgi:hypothetical protein
MKRRTDYPWLFSQLDIYTVLNSCLVSVLVGEQDKKEYRDMHFRH